MLNNKIVVAVVKSHAVKIVNEATLWRTLVDLKKVYKAKATSEGALPPLSSNEVGLIIEPVVEEVLYEIDLKEVDAKARVALEQQKASYQKWLENAGEIDYKISRGERLIATISDESLKKRLTLQLDAYKKANLPPRVSKFDDLLLHYYNIEVAKINRSAQNRPIDESSVLQKAVNRERELRLTLAARAKAAKERAEKDKSTAEEFMELLNQ